jgi:bacillithiol system protein YtxJ
MRIRAREATLKKMSARFNDINDTQQLETLFQKSFDEPVVLFKHSITCAISADVYREISNVDAEINLIIVQRTRNVSNAIAEKTGVRHESPQAIILKDGKAVYNASHYNIEAEEVEEMLDAG